MASVCDTCPSAYECGKLHSALVVFRAGEFDAADAATARFERLLDLLAAAGFSYPDGVMACALQGERQALRGKTDEAIEILAELRHRPSA